MLIAVWTFRVEYFGVDVGVDQYTTFNYKTDLVRVNSQSQKDSMLWVYSVYVIADFKNITYPTSVLDNNVKLRLWSTLLLSSQLKY